MPFNFSAPGPAKVAKLGVVADGNSYAGAPTVLKSGSTATLTLASTTVTLTGGAGFVSGDTGKKIYISGAATAANNGWFTITYVSATSVSWTNASGATDANNGKISWSTSVLGVSTLTTAPSNYTAFKAAPVRTGVGTWTITTKDSVVFTMGFFVVSVLPPGTSTNIKCQETTSVNNSDGTRTYGWTFIQNVSGTDTAVDLPYPASFRVWLMYSETKESV